MEVLLQAAWPTSRTFLSAELHTDQGPSRPSLAEGRQPLTGSTSLQVTVEMLNNQSITEMSAINQAILAEGRMDVGASISSEMLKHGNTQFMEVRPAAGCAFLLKQPNL